MASHSSVWAAQSPRTRACVAGVVLVGLVGSILDWMIVLSQFTQRGNVTPFVPPFALTMLVLGLVVSVPAITFTSRERSRPVAAAAAATLGTVVALVAMLLIGSSFRSADIAFTLIWFAPIAVITVPLVTGLAARTGPSWPRSVVVGLSVFILGTALMMWFGLPRV